MRGHDEILPIINHGEALRHCIDSLRTGRLAQAEAQGRAMLQDCPGDAVLWHLLGVIVARQDRADEALALFDKALEIVPAAAVLHDQATALHRLSRTHDALASLDKAVALDPDYVEAWHTRGLLLIELGEHASALMSFTRALALKPGYTEALVSSGKALHAMRRNDDALASYEAALSSDRRNFGALCGRARIFADTGQLDAAIASCDLALELRPDSPEAVMLRSDTFHRLGRYDEAIAGFDQAVALQGQSAQFYAEAHFLRANPLRKMGRLTEALTAYDTAIALRPDYAEAWNHRGIALRERGEHIDAIESHDTALRLQPRYIDAHVNRSIALHELGRDREAATTAQQALALQPESSAANVSLGISLRALGNIPEALACFEAALRRTHEPESVRFNRGLCLLLCGDFARGWPDYEYRWQTPARAAAAPDPGRPLWLGQYDITGRTILLHAEQGFGDTIQFCRYAPIVAAKGTTVLLGVPAPLRSLLKSLGGAVQVIDRAEEMPSFDVHCPLMSLPLACGTDAGSIPSQVPYLAPAEERRIIWRERLGERRGLRVGLAWSGSGEHKEDARRSMPIEAVAPLVDSGLELICLHRDLRPADVPGMAQFPGIRFFGHRLEDFSDTAALIAELDLVISVDTAVLHLAGALGRPVWALLPFAPDWRWMLDREDSPWYPTMRLFRQPVPGDWDSVIKRVSAELASRRMKQWDSASNDGAPSQDR